MNPDGYAGDVPFPATTLTENTTTPANPAKTTTSASTPANGVTSVNGVNGVKNHWMCVLWESDSIFVCLVVSENEECFWWWNNGLVIFWWCLRIIAVSFLVFKYHWMFILRSSRENIIHKWRLKDSSKIYAWKDEIINTEWKATEFIISLNLLDEIICSTTTVFDKH